MITDADLLRAYEQAFNQRMTAVDGISSRCHAAGLRAVAAYAAAQQRDELSVLVAHSGATDRREWHTVCAWLHPGEAIYEGRLLTALVTDAVPSKD